MCVLQYFWCSDADKRAQTVPVGTAFSLRTDAPAWMNAFMENKCIHVNAQDTVGVPQEIFRRHGTHRALLIPVYLLDRFWGFVSFSSTTRKTIYTDDEVHFLWSGSLMMIYSLQDHTMLSQAREAHKRTNVLLDTMPISCLLYDENHKLFYFNEATLKFFDVSDGRELLEYFDAFLPLFQPDGRLSRDVIHEHITRAFEEGADQNLLFMHQFKDGTPFPVEATLVRVNYGERYVVAVYLRDLREHIRMMEDIKEALEQAKTANLVKSNFFSSMSHEIRTPINAIIGIADLCSLQELTDIQKDYLDDIRTAAKSLLSILNSILDLSKIESGKISADTVDYDLHVLLQNINAMFRLVAKNKGIEFRLEIEDNLPKYLFGDDLKVRQIITNLCGNAVKFTGEGYVELKVYVREENLLFEIKDTGKGIPKEALPKLFDPYEQIDRTKNRSVIGTGLGLTISKAFAEVMGGKITVESEYGKGAVFTLTIPLVLGNKENVKYDIVDVMEEVNVCAPNARILVVDDLSINLKVASGLLGLFQIIPTTASSGQEAIDLVQQNEYDIVFMDHMMPNMDGVEATTMIRELGGKYENLTIIALTANAVQDARKMFLANGFNGFLSKPIIVSELNQTLMKWLPPQKIVEKKITEDMNNETTDSSAAFIETLRHIDDINVEIGLDNFAGAMNMYRETIEIFYKKLIDDCVIMTRFLEENDAANLAIHVHGMKSSLALVGATRMSKVAANMEAASKKGDIDYCREQFPALKEELLVLHEKLSAAFPDTGVVKEKPLGDAAYLRENVQRALNAADDFDRECCVEAVKNLLTYDFGEPTNGLLEQALSSLNEFNIGNAAEVLRNCTQITTPKEP